MTPDAAPLPPPAVGAADDDADTFDEDARPDVLAQVEADAGTAQWILAIWMAGHVSVPMYSTSSAQTLRQILEHSDARLLFVPPPPPQRWDPDQS